MCIILVSTLFTLRSCANIMMRCAYERQEAKYYVE